MLKIGRIIHLSKIVTFLINYGSPDFEFGVKYFNLENISVMYLKMIKKVYNLTVSYNN